MNIDFEVTPKQLEFIEAEVDELLYGGAAGGGKSYVQLIDAYRYALQYEKSKQLILRRTFPELNKSLIRVSRDIYSQDICKYKESDHTYTFRNGSIIDFGYCDSENDVYKYQSAEYDVIRFDELTHFTEFMYIYFLSRVRGVTPCPRGVKSTSNPGNIGHSWVKERWKIGEETGVFKVKSNGTETTRLFIPAKVQDNPFLIERDPDYIARLNQLPERERKMLRDGDWDVFEGQYFPEFDKNIHVIEPMQIPQWWQKYTVMDYGLDMLAHYWIAVDDYNNAYVVNELYESGLIVSEAVEKIKKYEKALGWTGYIQRLAPPDLWNTQSITGKSTAILFSEYGLMLDKSNNDRVDGWLAVKELLKVEDKLQPDGTRRKEARLKIFKNCTNLIRTLPQILVDEKNPNDCAREPHELTHAPDALRYFAIAWTRSGITPKSAKKNILPPELRDDKPRGGYNLWE